MLDAAAAVSVGSRGSSSGHALSIEDNSDNKMQVLRHHKLVRLFLRGTYSREGR